MSLTKVSYSMIAGAVANVLDFGADPTGTTDSTTAIQAAIDSLGTAGTVFIPKGTYKANGVVWKDRINIVGDGKRATFLRSTTANPLFTYTSVGTEQRGSLRYMTIDGNSVGTIGVSLSGANRFYMEELEVTNFTQFGMKILAASVWQLERSEIFNCVIGVSAGSDGRPGDLARIQDTRFQNNTKYGLIIQSGAVFTVAGCEFGSNGVIGDSTAYALYIGDMTNPGNGPAVTVQSCYFEDNRGNAAIKVAAPVLAPSLVMIKDTTIFDNADCDYGLFVQGAGLQYWAENVVAQGSAIADFFDDSTIELGFRFNCVGATSTSGTKTTQWPIASGGAAGVFLTSNKNRIPQLMFARQSQSAATSTPINATIYNQFDITLGSAGPFTIANPTVVSGDNTGRIITIQFKNLSGGGVTAISFGTAYKTASWSSLATSMARTLTFQYDGTNWQEIARSGDIPQ